MSKKRDSVLADYRRELDRRTARRAKDRAAGKKPRISVLQNRQPLQHPVAQSRKEALALAKQRGLDPPDFDAGCGHYGSKLSDHPQPFIRKWPLAYPRKRKVEVSVTKYYGLGVHYYVTLREEENPIWSVDPDPEFRRDNGHWVKCWEDPDVDGLTISERCMTPTDVNLFVQQAFAEHFNPKTHKLVDRYERSNQKWFYREGD